MNDSQIAIRSLDAVEIRMDLAGAGSRAYAFLIDWHIRVLAAIVIGVAAGAVEQWLSAGEGAAIEDSLYALLAVAAVYFLYHPVLELALRGLTPGKRWAGLRIVMRDGSPPGSGALLVRNLFRMIDSLPVFYALGLTLMLASDRSLRLGDLAAGTCVIHDSPARAGGLQRASRPSTHLQPATRQLLEEWLARWSQLDAASRDEIAKRALLREGAAAAAAGDLSGAALRDQVRALVDA